ncbi:hypothetical protein [Halomonas sp. B23F22_10]
MSDAAQPEEQQGYEDTAFTADRIPRLAPPPFNDPLVSALPH